MLMLAKGAPNCSEKNSLTIPFLQPIKRLGVVVENLLHRGLSNLAFFRALFEQAEKFVFHR